MSWVHISALESVKDVIGSNIFQKTTILQESNRIEGVINSTHIHVVKTLVGDDTGQNLLSSHKIFPPFDFSYLASHLFWLTLSFGTFYYIMVSFVLPRIGHILDKRNSAIKDNLDLAEKSKNDADKMISYYTDTLKETRKKARDLITESLAKTRSDTLKERKKVENSLKKQLIASCKELEKTRETALKNSGPAVIEVSQAMVKKILGKEIDPNSIKRIFDEIKG